MFKLKEIDTWEIKRKEAINKLIKKGEKFKKESIEKWKDKLRNSKKENNIHIPNFKF